MQTKKIPMRMCCGCNERKAKSDLVRVVKDSEGNLFLDRTGKKNGRGAYLCPNADCLTKAIRSKRMDKCLDAQIPDELYQRLREELS